ncbi:hypothetical protein CW733_06645 [Lacinutrix sp. Bg11-31]|nr:hypothetical protein CW733_06645 [Lacinutrix sp. Bg11-31]
MMHIPTGLDNYGGLMWNNRETVNITKDRDTLSLSFQNVFLELVDSKKTQIKGILTSHTHFDGLRCLYNSDSADAKKLIAVSLCTPEITINHGNNPGFKLFEYNADTLDVLQLSYAKPTVSSGQFEFFGDNYSFKNTYVISDPKEIIYESIAGMDSEEVVEYMSEILAVKNYKTNKIVRTYDFMKVMNVLKNQ